MVFKNQRRKMKLGGGEEEEKRSSWRGRRRKGMAHSIFKDTLYEFCKQFLKRVTENNVSAHMLCLIKSLF